MGEQKGIKKEATSSQQRTSITKSKSSKARDARPARSAYTNSKRWLVNKARRLRRFMAKHPGWKIKDQHPGLNEDFAFYYEHNMARSR